VRLDLLGHPGCVDGLLEVGQVAATLLVFTQLLLDGLELFAQHELALALVHALLGALVNLLRQLEHLNTAREQFQHPVQTRLHVERFQHLLFLFELDVEEARDHVRQSARGGEVLHCTGEFLRRLRQQFEASAARRFNWMKRASTSWLAVSPSAKRSTRATKNG